jgi:hypothetical protein
MRRALVVVAALSGLPALSCACRQAAPGPAVPAAAPAAAPAAGRGADDPTRVPRE